MLAIRSKLSLECQNPGRHGCWPCSLHAFQSGGWVVWLSTNNVSSLFASWHDLATCHMMSHVCSVPTFSHKTKPYKANRWTLGCCWFYTTKPLENCIPSGSISENTVWLRLWSLQFLGKIRDNAKRPREKHQSASRVGLVTRLGSSLHASPPNML